ncbi:MAG: mechanosensitive ion channel family protein [Anaerolineales bacterium]|nr:mechanosensitive ion channel family protein [Anaerolineales bacterium]
MTQIFGQSVFGNLVRDWALALAIFLLVYLGYGVIKHFALRHFSGLGERPGRQFSGLIKDLLKRTKGCLVFFLSLYLASLALTLPSEADNLLRVLAVVILIIQSGLWGTGLIDYLIQRRIQAETQEEEVIATTMNAVRLVARIGLWSVVILLILENVTGVEMNTLIATLGITGVAVALAVQNILGDLFSSVSIALDKPFVIGDLITVGNFSGTIESIGLKSTRLRSVSGEELVFSNSDLLSSRIQNYRNLQRRRVLFTLGVAPATPYEKLVAIPGMLKEIIEAHDKTSYERVHFKEFGEYSLNFECIYFIESPDIKYYMDCLHAINLEIHRRFAEQGIQFASPTQTIIMETGKPG